MMREMLINEKLDDACYHSGNPGDDSRSGSKVDGTKNHQRSDVRLNSVKTAQIAYTKQAFRSVLLSNHHDYSKKIC